MLVFGGCIRNTKILMFFFFGGGVEGFIVVNRLLLLKSLRLGSCPTGLSLKSVRIHPDQNDCNENHQILIN